MRMPLVVQARGRDRRDNRAATAGLIASVVFPVPPFCAINVTVYTLTTLCFEHSRVQFLSGLRKAEGPVLRRRFFPALTRQPPLTVPRGDRLLKILRRPQRRCLENSLGRLAGIQAVEPVRGRSQRLSDRSDQDGPLPAQPALVHDQARPSSSVSGGIPGTTGH